MNLETAEKIKKAKMIGLHIILTDKPKTQNSLIREFKREIQAQNIFLDQSLVYHCLSFSLKKASEIMLKELAQKTK